MPLGIPMALVNARLSEKSFNQAMRVPELMKKAMGRFTKVCAQAESDAQRLKAMGTVEPVITGSLKFDIQAPAEALAKAAQWKLGISKPIVMFASTRDGEEALIVESLKEQAKPEVCYLLVPRSSAALCRSRRAFKVSRSTLSKTQSFKESG